MGTKDEEFRNRARIGITDLAGQRMDEQYRRSLPHSEHALYWAEWCEDCAEEYAELLEGMEEPDFVFLGAN
jgi:hypothetical protein